MTAFDCGYVMSDTIRSYRFQRIREHVLGCLKDSTLYFAAPPTLNDPDDCQINITAAIARAMQEALGARLELLRKIWKLRFIPIMQEDLPKTGVCCFSLELENSLMWSHYADSHKGICFYYEIPIEFLEPNRIIGWSPVTYGKNPLTNWLLNDLDVNADPSEACIQIAQCVLTMKSRSGPVSLDS